MWKNVGEREHQTYRYNSTNVDISYVKRKKKKERQYWPTEIIMLYKVNHFIWKTLKFLP